MRVTLTLLAALWGAGAGLLLPRAAHRLSVEAEQPWRGQCHGGHPLDGSFGGWVGRARCTAAPACGTYGPATPAVVTVTVLVCAALAAATGPRPEAVVWLSAAPVGVLLALVDHRVHRLPDVLTLPLAAATAALLGLAALLPASAGSWPTALLGGLALGAAYFVLHLVNPSGMGFGDVKLALGLGAALGWYGWPVLILGGFAGLLYGSVYGLGLVLLRRAGRKSAIPLGPFMLGGALTGLLLGAATAT
ncbi:prepilin peptidase [Streptomyces naganishii]|uniref:Prepilin peptidase n=1 Tax=Streptomyces naganishii JCM 4654 TaxID=1306179 RepID=A0A919CZ73_9ACTN|nr:prepilin peptidase [Streptomyces naganishii]GHD93666.1 prepilin peptidase [Streptomyces naganishii JCM 4654]